MMVAVEGSPATTTARLVVSRPPPGGLGDQYPIRVWVDGADAGVLMPGESVARDLAPGAHQVRASNTLLSRRLAFELAAGDEVRLTTFNRSSWATILFALLGAGPLSLELRRELAPAAGRQR
jgi:hypothetical protein